MSTVLSSAGELPESGSTHWSHQETVKDWAIPEIDGSTAEVRILVYWPARGTGLRMKEATFDLLWCDSSLMEPGVWGGWGVWGGSVSGQSKWKAFHDDLASIITLLHLVLLTVSWLWRSRQTLGHSSRKPNPASWLQHELCSREKREKPADITPAASITITPLTNRKP